MKLLRILATAAAAFGAVGCSSSAVHLESASDDGRLAPAARYALNADGTAEATIVVEAEGTRDDDVAGRTTDTARVRITVSNASESAVQLPFGEISAKDDRGRALPRIGVYAPAGAEGDTLVVPGGGVASVEAAFDLGAPDLWAGTGSVTFAWSYLFRGASRRHETRFLPVRYVTRYYERPAYVGFGFGFGRRWCR
jgi:hypothetical protein